MAATILLPSAFLMGGTLPLMGQHVIRAGARLGTGGAALYAVNTLGGATGALAAGFVLPIALGFKAAHLLAVGLDLAVGVVALALARRRAEGMAAVAAARAGPAFRLPPLVWTIAFVSGFVTLAVEVPWTRLFALVLQNSVYNYALVLVTFLLALALGAVLANLLNRQRRVPAEIVTLALLVLSAPIVASTPLLFHALTEGLGYLGHGRPFWGYVGTVAGTAALAMLLPGIVLGTVLPCLPRLLERGAAAAGEALGRLLAVDTTGAILGVLAVGFVLIPALRHLARALAPGGALCAGGWGHARRPVAPASSARGRRSRHGSGNLVAGDAAARGPADDPGESGAGRAAGRDARGAGGTCRGDRAGRASLHPGHQLLHAGRYWCAGGRAQPGARGHLLPRSRSSGWWCARSWARWWTSRRRISGLT